MRSTLSDCILCEKCFIEVSTLPEIAIIPTRLLIMNKPRSERIFDDIKVGGQDQILCNGCRIVAASIMDPVFKNLRKALSNLEPVLQEAARVIQYQ